MPLFVFSFPILICKKILISMYYNATQYEKFKFNFGNLSPVYLQTIVLFISFITGNILRYNLLDTIHYYQGQSLILHILTDLTLVIIKRPRKS